MKVVLIDSQGFYLEDLPFPSAEDLQRSNVVATIPPDGLNRPLWNGQAWVEGKPDEVLEPVPVKEDYQGLFMALIDPDRGGKLYNRVLATAEIYQIVLANFVVFSAALTQTKNLMALMAAFYRLQSALAAVGEGLTIDEESVWNGLAETHGFPELVIPMSSPLP